MGSSDKTASFDGGLLLPGGQLAGVRVTKVNGRILTALVGAVGLQPEVRCAFRQDGHRIELMGDVTGKQEHGGKTLARIQVKALFSKGGIDVLGAFLRERFDIASPGDLLTQNQVGAFFAFDSKTHLALRNSGVRVRRPTVPSGPAAKSDAAPARQAPVEVEDPKERRWRSRVRASAAVDANTAAANFAGVMVDAAIRGLRLRLLTDVRPRVDSPIRIRIPIMAGRLPIEVDAQGEVRWITESGDGPAECGIELDRVTDGASGVRWKRYIEALEATDEIILSAKRGDARPEAA